MKAIAIHTIFIVVTTVIFLFFAVVVLFGLLGSVNISASQTTCTIKLLNYCTSWAAKGFSESDKPYQWNEKSPYACGQFLKDISDDSGPSKDQCKPIVK